jgi:dTDP-4-dehydrorhamnose reductase
MNKVLITGANGQLGSEIRNLSAEYPDFQFIYTDIDNLDITDKKAINELFEEHNGIEYLINCAAYTAVDKAEEDTELANKINVEAVANLSEICNSFGTKMIHISTDYVFDGTNYQPYKESDPCSPNSAYGRTKLDGELTFQESGVEGIIIRTSWLYSTYGHNFVKTILRLSNERDQLGVIFDQIGTPTWAHDLAKAILDILKFSEHEPDAIKTGIYHYSNEGVCSWYDFATEIAEYASHACVINAIEGKEYPLPAPRPFYSVLNKSAIKASFDIKIPHWKNSLHQCIDLILDS